MLSEGLLFDFAFLKHCYISSYVIVIVGGTVLVIVTT
jgi:hypothetical protein